MSSLEGPEQLFYFEEAALKSAACGVPPIKLLEELPIKRRLLSNAKGAVVHMPANAESDTKHFVELASQNPRRENRFDAQTITFVASA
jgi:hypothetical protein